jgi:hypothetical protein
MRHAIALVMAGSLLLAAAPPPAPQTATAAPTLVGQCVRAKIVSKGQRLMDARTSLPIRGSGSLVRFSNLIEQVSYDEVPAIERARIGDRVRMCLVQLPADCPAGDDRGKVYRTTDLRTGRAWTLPDSEHSCGGA